MSTPLMSALRGSIGGRHAPSKPRSDPAPATKLNYLIPNRRMVGLSNGPAGAIGL